MIDLILSAAMMTGQAPARAPGCQSALGPLYGGAEETDLPGQVDGNEIASPAALIALRAGRGDSLLTVKGGNFAGADLRGARLDNICFLDTHLAGSDWRGASASGTGFVRSDLSGARLAGANLAGVLFRQPMLAQADASNADLSGGRLDGGWDGSLVDLRLDGANLSNFHFDCGITLGDGCPIERGISFRRANLSGARLNSYWGDGRDDWTGARIDRTEVGLHQLQEVAAVDMTGPLLVRGGDAVVQIDAAELRTLRAQMRPAEPAAAPSFDCRRATARVERLICAADSGYLRALDREVASLYRRARARDPAMTAGQSAWLQQRNLCAGAEALFWSCVQEAYERRRAELAGRIGPPQWLRPGATVLFVMPVVEFEESFRRDTLYRRLLPVIDGAASAHVAVRVNADGSVDARGDAIGANAHSCTVAADGLRLDAGTGWYSAARGDTEDPPPWRGRPVPVLLFWDERAKVYRNGHSEGGDDGVDARAGDYASCGARAGFDDLIRLPVSDDEARTVFDGYQDME